VGLCDVVYLLLALVGCELAADHAVVLITRAITISFDAVLVLPRGVGILEVVIIHGFLPVVCCKLVFVRHELLLLLHGILWGCAIDLHRIAAGL
jgi:hypothetical protein